MSDLEKRRMKELGDAYGADPARWPADDRHLAKASGAADLRSAAKLDAVLDQASIPPVPKAFAVKIVAAATNKAEPQPSNIVPFPRKKVVPNGGWLVATALAASLAIGICLGASSSGDIFFPASETASLDDPLDLMSIDQADETISGDHV